MPLRACLAAALEFRNANRPLARDAAYYSWRYLERPCAAEALIAWAHTADAPVAAVTIAPHDFVSSGNSLRLGIVGDISVSSAHRGGGVGKDILSFVAAATSARELRCLVLPNPPAEAALRRGGWEPLVAIERLVRPLRAAGNPLRGALAVSLHCADAVQRTLYPVAAMEAEELGPDFNELWERADKQGCTLAVRTRNYLEWRYKRHPTERYTFLALRRRGVLEGYVVVHTEHQSLIVADYLLANSALGVALAAQLVSWGRLHGFVDIHVRTSGVRWNVPWGRLGFIRRHDPIQAMTSPAAADPRATSPWFLTSGDKDV